MSIKQIAGIRYLFIFKTNKQIIDHLLKKSENKYAKLDGKVKQQSSEYSFSRNGEH